MQEDETPTVKLQSMKQIKAEYDKQIEERYGRNITTEEMEAIKSFPGTARAISDNTCARVNALLAYGKNVTIEIYLNGELMPIGTVKCHPYMDDILLVTRKGEYDRYIQIPGYTVFSMTLYKR